MIYVVIPVFNRLEFTVSCLYSLRAQSNKHFKVVVVDHGSSDGTSLHLHKYFPEVDVVHGDATMWWSAATNIGIEYALHQGASYILTLNNDTIATPDYIQELWLAVQDSPEGSLIGSTALDVNTGNVIYRGEQLKWLSASTKYLDEDDKPLQNGAVEVSHFPGRGLLVPKAVFAKIGLFDDIRFPHYMADYDFTLRAKKSGFHLFCSWHAKISIYPEASGANQLKVTKTLKGYKQHLFGIKGGGNLPLFFKYAVRNCPGYALPSHLLLGTMRRVVGYWL